MTVRMENGTSLSEGDIIMRVDNQSWVIERITTRSEIWVRSTVTGHARLWQRTMRIHPQQIIKHNANQD